MKQQSFLQEFAPVLTAIGSIFLLFLIILPATSIPSIDDGIRHYTIAKLMGEHGIRWFHGWGDFFFAGYFTKWNSDPWFLSDILLIPLAKLPLLTYYKTLSIINASLLVSILLLFLRSLRIPSMQGTWIVLLFLFGEYSFIQRLFLARPFALLTCTFLLSIWCVLYRRWLVLFCILMIATLLSHLFVFSLAASILGSLWLWTIGERKNAAFISLAAMMGVATGLFLHPQTIAYSHYLLNVFFRIPFLKDIGLGNELYTGLNMGTSVVQLLFGLLTLLICLGISSKKLTAQKCHTTGLTYTGTLGIGLFGCFLFWTRAIDFAWPVLVIIYAQILSALPSLPELVRKHAAEMRISMKMIKISFSLILIATIARFSYPFLWKHAPSPFAYYQSLNVIPSGAKVINTDWDFFPMYFYLRPDLLFVQGMDPAFTYLDNKEAFALFAKLYNESEQSEDSLPDASEWLRTIRTHYDGEYLVVLRYYHESFVEHLKELPELTQMDTNQDNVAIFKIENQGE